MGKRNMIKILVKKDFDHRLVQAVSILLSCLTITFAELS